MTYQLPKILNIERKEQTKITAKKGFFQKKREKILTILNRKHFKYLIPQLQNTEEEKNHETSITEEEK